MLFKYLQVIKEHINTVSYASQKQWFTISERLQGWRCEKRQRNTGNQVDKVDYLAFFFIFIDLIQLNVATDV